MMAFDKGSLILVDYTAKIKDSGRIFDTTSEDDAKKYGVHDPDAKYQPRIVSVGEPGFAVLRGLDEALADADVGAQLTVEVPPEKGFGARDPGKIRMIPQRKLGEDAEKVSVGDTVDIDGRRAVIRFIGSGRVQIDYNHRYAGETIIFDAAVKKLLDADEEKISEILKHRMPVPDEDISFTVSEQGADITIPDKLHRAEQLQQLKHFVQMDIFRFVPGLETINFIETHRKRKPEQPGQAAPHHDAA